MVNTSRVEPEPEPEATSGTIDGFLQILQLASQAPQIRIWNSTKPSALHLFFEILFILFITKVNSMDSRNIVHNKWKF